MNAVVTIDTGLTALAVPAGPPAAGSPTWITVRPDVRRGAAVAADLLTALGKDRNWHGKGRNEQEDVVLASAWITALQVTALVVVNAQEAPLPTLDVLRDIARDCGIDLWLLYRAPIDDRTHRKITKMSTRTATLLDVPPHSPRPQNVHETPDAIAVPTVTFPAFRAALLTDPRYAPALDLYDAELTAGQDAIQRGTATHDALTTRALRILRDAPNDGELVARLTALQVLAWRHDQFLDVDLPALIHSADRPRTGALWLDQQLLAYRQPQRAIVTALTRRGVALQTIDALTVGDVTTDGHLQDPGLDPVDSADLRVAVHAQRLLRLAQGAQGTDRLLVPDAKTLARFVNDAATDIGAHAGGRRVERALHPVTWLSRLGITLQSL